MYLIDGYDLIDAIKEFKKMYSIDHTDSYAVEEYIRGCWDAYNTTINLINGFMICSLEIGEVDFLTILNIFINQTQRDLEYLNTEINNIKGDKIDNYKQKKYILLKNTLEECIELKYRISERRDILKSFKEGEEDETN